MLIFFKENKRLKEKIKLLEEQNENLKEQLKTQEWGKEFGICRFCGWKVIYTWYDHHWLADIKCIGCGAKWFVNIMFMD